MTIDLNPSAESSNHKLAAAFESTSDAASAGQRLNQSSQLGKRQVDVLDPSTVNPDRRLLPETSNIWRTWLRAHALFGLAGALMGLALYLSLRSADVAMITSNPVLAGIVFLHVFTLLGLLAGGLFSLRPDQSFFAHAAKEALSKGQSVLVVHARSKRQQRSIEAQLHDSALEVIRTA